MDGVREFARTAVTPGFGAVSAVSTLLGFTDVGAMSQTAWLAVGYITLVGFASRLWWDQQQRAVNAEKRIDSLTSEVHGSLEGQIDVQRVLLPQPPHICFALTFGIRFKNTSKVRVAVRILRAGFTVNNPTTGAHESDVSIVNNPEDFTLQPKRKRWWNADHKWAPRQLPGWIDGDGNYAVEYGAEDSERRFRLTCDFHWRNHPNGNTEFMLLGSDRVKDVAL